VGHVLVAPDKFKGSLPADAVAARVVAGLVAARPGLTALALPVADGGDGTLDAAVAAGYDRREVRVTGPTGRPVASAVAVRGEVAVVEMAAASGLVLLPDGRFDPLGAGSRGTGELIRAALDAGCTEIVLGVGGSACTDGGAGMLQALGARLLDASGAELPAGGAALARLDRVDLAGLDPRLAGTHFLLASDVDNPLLGARGAAAVYGPQKGASPADIEVLDAALTRWADAVDPAAATKAGAGAAGGVGYAALAVLQARRRSGIELVLELIGFADRLAGASLVVTGEGSLDEQTLQGKAVAGVAEASRAAGVPVVAVCGRCLLQPDALLAAGISRAYPLSDLEPDIRRSMADPGPLVEALAGRIAADWLPATG
jgi:glycerate kinase